MGPGCRVYIDYTAWPKAEPRVECGLRTDVAFLTGLPAGASVRVWNGTVAYELVASSTGVVVLGGLKPGAYEVKVYSDTLSIPHDHLLRLDPLTGLRQFFGFWDRLTFSLFTPVFVVGLVLAVYLRTWSAVLTALVALVAHIVVAPDNIWIRGLLALALAVAVYIAVWRRYSVLG
jgi:flagellar biosynthesis protein FlhB